MLRPNGHLEVRAKILFSVRESSALSMYALKLPVRNVVLWLQCPISATPTFSCTSGSMEQLPEDPRSPPPAMPILRGEHNALRRHASVLEGNLREQA